MVFINKKGRIVYANKKCEEMMKYKREEFYSPDFNFLSLIAPEYIELIKIKFEKHAKGEEVEPYEYAIITKEGKRIEAISNTVLMDYEGERAILGIITDITEKKKAEEAIYKSEELLKLQINRMPVGYIVWDTGFRVVSWNPASERIFGFTLEEAKGKHSYDIIVPKEMQPHVDIVWSRLLDGDTTAHSVNENLTKDGRTIICEWTNTPLRYHNGDIIGVLSMVQDITERKKAEEKLRQYVDELERFQKVAVKREFRIKELQERVMELEGRQGEGEKG
jgi:PAS domain S-box-containing protein